MDTIVLYEGEKYLGRGNKGMREKLGHNVKAQCFRILFLDVEDDIVTNLEEIGIISKQQLANTIRSSMDENRRTTYMN